MDPASAIGVASSVITFASFTRKFLTTVSSIYKSSTGQSLAHQTLEDVTLHMQRLSTGLVSLKPTMDQSKDEIVVSNLALRCSELAERIIILLKKTQATKGKDGYSLIASLRAASKTVWTKNEISQLQESLDQCMTLLLQQWSILESSETKQALRKLLKAAVSDANEFASVHRLLQNGVGLNRAALDNVREIFSLSGQQLQAGNRNHILKALDFDMMDERYHDVSKSAADTFTWIFNEEERPSHLDTKISFKEWLATGDGIFHISGKPGSGKSTLMKFLCQNQQTKEGLQLWAGTRKLVFARFFFWRPGNALQSSLLGLVRSLLFHVLAQCPEAFSLVFPQYWEPTEFQPWIFHPQLKIGDDELFDAFDELIRNPSFYRHQRFCFFIDGLDEFEERFRTYGDLVTSLNDWVKASAGGVKICVSSREFHIFQKNLPDQQRIQLQALTRCDIENVVHQKLDQHLEELELKNPSGCEELVRQIVDKADGVFLWVVLTLKLLCDGLESLYSIPDLLRKLDAIPRELKEFFRHILDLIDEADHKKAYCTLAVAIEANKSDISLNLFRYSFLTEIVDDPEYAKKLPFQDMTFEQVRDRQAIAAAQLTGLCRGLLELRDATKNDFDSVKNIIQGTSLTFTHRSIPEFLKDHLQNESQKYVDDFDPLDALIQTFLAAFKSTWFDLQPQKSFRDVSDLVYCIRDSETLNKTRYFESLYILDTALKKRQLERYPTFSKVKWAEFTPTTWNFNDRPFFISVLHVAGYIWFHEYVTWQATRFPDELEGSNGIELLQGAVDSCESASNDERIGVYLEELFRRGVDPNCIANDPEWDGLTLWVYHLIRSSITGDFSATSWKAVEVFLRFGAEPVSWFHNLPEKGIGVAAEKDEDPGTLTLTFGQRTYQLTGSYHYPICWQPSGIPECLKNPGGQATLRDWVDWKEPENADKIRELLDKIEEAELSSNADEDTPTLLDSEETVEAESAIISQSATPDSIKARVDRIPSPSFWTQFGQPLQNPILPWFLFGSLSIIMLTRQVFPSIANIFIRARIAKGA